MQTSRCAYLLPFPKRQHNDTIMGPEKVSREKSFNGANFRRNKLSQMRTFCISKEENFVQRFSPAKVDILSFIHFHNQLNPRTTAYSDPRPSPDHPPTTPPPRHPPLINLWLEAYEIGQDLCLGILYLCIINI